MRDGPAGVSYCCANEGEGDADESCRAFEGAGLVLRLEVRGDDTVADGPASTADVDPVFCRLNRDMMGSECASEAWRVEKQGGCIGLRVEKERSRLT